MSLGNGKVQEGFTVSPATARAVADNLLGAAETLSGDMRDAVIDMIKDIDKPWSKLSAAQQEMRARDIELRCERLIERAVMMISTAGAPHVTCRIAKITIDDKGTKLAIEQVHEPDDDPLDVIHIRGHKVAIVSADHRRFKGEQAPFKGAPDQPDFFDAAADEADRQVRENAAAPPDGDAPAAEAMPGAERLGDLLLDVGSSQAKLPKRAVAKLRRELARAAGRVLGRAIDGIGSLFDFHIAVDQEALAFRWSDGRFEVAAYLTAGGEILVDGLMMPAVAAIEHFIDRWVKAADQVAAETFAAGTVTRENLHARLHPHGSAYGELSPKVMVALQAELSARPARIVEWFDEDQGAPFFRLELDGEEVAFGAGEDGRYGVYCHTLADASATTGNQLSAVKVARFLRRWIAAGAAAQPIAEEADTAAAMAEVVDALADRIEGEPEAATV